MKKALLIMTVFMTLSAMAQELLNIPTAEPSNEMLILGDSKLLFQDAYVHDNKIYHGRMVGKVPAGTQLTVTEVNRTSTGTVLHIKTAASEGYIISGFSSCTVNREASRAMSDYRRCNNLISNDIKKAQDYYDDSSVGLR